jgi:hypothetical protein
MRLPEFEDLPFYERPDLTPYLVHLTKNTKQEDGYSAFENLVNILREGKICGSDSSKGFIKGRRRATCFMDVPFSALKYVLNPRDSNPDNPRYEPYGVVVTKKYAYKAGCRPVLYLSDKETRELGIPSDELWRVVRFEVTDQGWISWLHEREWRCPGSFEVPGNLQVALVKNMSEVEKLTTLIQKNPGDFELIPRSIVPLTIICQGLPKR